ncbi:glycosyltransferase family A protein [Bacillus sp. JJ1533]|uniref:glycosyltransferase family 2 protein n=1 Tax=Bacillus sp. JJ1533 TaxID=3122959 RepID=UPI002FFD6569
MYTVSVIIPTHNRPDSLLLTLNSVINQTVKPYEVIVVIDGNSPDIEELLQSYGTNGIPLLIEHLKQKKGACFARNHGANRSTGDILMFLDDDDIWEPTKVEDQLNVFKAKPEVGLVYSGRIVVYEDDRSTPIRKITPVMKGKLFPHIFYDNYIGTTSSVALKRSLFMEVGGFDVNLPAMQDYDLWIRFCKLTSVDHDSKYNVRYSVYRNPDLHIGGKGNYHKFVVNYMMKKYKDELEQLSPKVKRRFKSSRFLHVAKAVYKKSYIRSLRFSMKSYINYPNIKAIVLLFPKGLATRLSKRIY